VDGYRRPSLPAAVARQLRQEAGFGCAKCGHPYIEYHHIIPWAQEQHFRPEDMVALCGNCHPSVSLLGNDRQYAIKAKPFNIAEGRFQGALAYDKRDLTFKVGGNWYADTPVILQLCNTPLISCRLDNGQAMVSLVMLDEECHQTLAIQDNEIIFRTDDMWDFKYSHNLIVAHSAPRDIQLKLDFRGDEAIIEGKLQIGNDKIELSAEQTVLPGYNSMKGCRMKGSRVGIQLGSENEILPVRCRI
jgi:HNH endonuclease